MPCWCRPRPCETAACSWSADRARPAPRRRGSACTGRALTEIRAGLAPGELVVVEPPAGAGTAAIACGIEPVSPRRRTARLNGWPRPLFLDIALGHLRRRKRQTIVSILGVALGVGFFIGINSLMRGFQQYFVSQIIDVAAAHRHQGRVPPAVAAAGAGGVSRWRGRDQRREAQGRAARHPQRPRQGSPMLEAHPGRWRRHRRCRARRSCATARATCRSPSTASSPSASGGSPTSRRT